MEESYRAFNRMEILLGKDTLRRLKKSFVVIAGVGSVGGYAFEGLVRANIGRIRIIDPDILSMSDINRQILATNETIGCFKVEMAKKHAEKINPDVTVETIKEMASAENLDRVFSENPDYFIDATDTIENKAMLLKEAARRNIKTFSSMGAALHLDVQMIRITTLKNTKVCPLASSIRHRLRDLDTSNITCVYSEERPLRKPTCRDEYGKSILGSLPTIPAIFGMILANQVIMDATRNK